MVLLTRSSPWKLDHKMTLYSMQIPVNGQGEMCLSRKIILTKNKYFKQAKLKLKKSHFGYNKWIIQSFFFPLESCTVKLNNSLNTRRTIYTGNNSLIIFSKIWEEVILVLVCFAACIYLLKVNNGNTKIMVSLLLTFNRFHAFFWCFHCWFWTSNYR